MKTIISLVLVAGVMAGCASTQMDPLVQPDGSRRVAINNFSLPSPLLASYIKRASERPEKPLADVALPVAKESIQSKSTSVFFTKSSRVFVPTDEHKALLTKAKSALSIRITGFTSGKFNNPANHEVATGRAEALKSWLVSNGVSAEKITVKADEDNAPIAVAKKWRADVAMELIGGHSEGILAIATARDIADATKLKFSSGGMPDETIASQPSNDPVGLLRDIAQKSSYGIVIDRELGTIVMTPSAKDRVMVIEDKNPVVYVGSPIILEAIPKEPIRLEQAMRLLVPNDWNIGFENGIERDIIVDVSKVKDWQDGLRQLALQTPYRLVWDWSLRQLVAVSLNNSFYSSKD